MSQSTRPKQNKIKQMKPKNYHNGAFK